MRVTRGGGRLLAGLCLAVMVGQAWAVNKCVGADGRVFVFRVSVSGGFGPVPLVDRSPDSVG